MADTNVIAVTFPEESKAYQALSELRQASDAGRLDLVSAAVVRRAPDGHLSVPEQEDAAGAAGTTTGGLVGMLIGVLGGPLGMLMGWGAGALVGGLLDIDRAERSADVLTEFGQAVPPGQTALLAQVTEYATEVVDGQVSALGGTVYRRPVTEVVAELEAASAAAEAAQAEARRVVREQKRSERKEKLDERLASLKTRLHIGD